MEARRNRVYKRVFTEKTGTVFVFVGKKYQSGKKKQGADIGGRGNRYSSNKIEEVQDMQQSKLLVKDEKQPLLELSTVVPVSESTAEKKGLSPIF